MLFPDGFNEPDSHEIIISKVAEKNKGPSRKKTGVNKDSRGQTDVRSRVVQNQGSRGQHGQHGQHGQQQASTEQIDHSSEEATIVAVQRAEPLSEKQIIRSSRDQTTDSLGTNPQRKATPARINGLNGVLAPGQSRELLDLDSLEENNGGSTPGGNGGHTDYDGKTFCKIQNCISKIVF